jgi:hypothetical protein
VKEQRWEREKLIDTWTKMGGSERTRERRRKHRERGVKEKRWGERD